MEAAAKQPIISAQLERAINFPGLGEPVRSRRSYKSVGLSESICGLKCARTLSNKTARRSSSVSLRRAAFFIMGAFPEAFFIAAGFRDASFIMDFPLAFFFIAFPLAAFIVVFPG